MDRSETITLIKPKITYGNFGQSIISEEVKEVFCSIRSISGSEWMEAGRIGMRPEFKIILFRYDYDGEDQVEYGGKRYVVYRTYIGTNDTMELYVEKRAGVSNGES